METPIAYLPRPLPHQLPILLDEHRFKLLVCGRRFGKTATGLLAATRGHGARRGQFRGAIDGGTIWWVAPSYPTIVASNIWNDLKKALSGCWLTKSEIDRTITLPSGGSITIRSADNPDSLRGPGLDGVVVDEAAFLSVSAWTKSIRPALTDKQGWAMLTTTPNGRNWIHERFQKCVDDPLWTRWQLPSWTNPLVTDEEMDDVRRDIGPRAFAQEHGAEFTDIEGALWASDLFAEHIWAPLWAGSFDFSVMAIDPSMGKTDRSDYSAIVFLGIRNGQLWVDCSIDRRPPLQIVEDAFAMFDRYRPIGVGVESNGFQAVLQPLFDLISQRENRPPLPLYLLQNSDKKEQRIQRLDPYLANRQFQFRQDSDDCRELVDQMMMFPNKGYHDDGPDALEMAIRLATDIQSRGGGNVESIAVA